ncbi:MAG: response regulator [Bacteroidia bacterium]
MKYNPTVLLIDDDTDDHEIFNIALLDADESARCIFASDGLHALEKINTDQTFIPDFIFLDVNMPRMNGQQCLREIKKIERLKDVPVFMYSTTSDPAIIAENIKSGATDFIIKPADITVLTGILSNIIKSRLMPLIVFVFCLGILPSYVFSQPDSLPAVNELKKLSVEELMNIVVTSVSKTPEKLTEVASAIQVVTSEEIQRSGALRLPGALRLATNMQVTASGAHDIRISSRGFNGFPIANSSLANKLLVLIDGRTVYTPLFGGVYWDVQNVLMEDLKQIEVISGPGGTLWGANAVNGIVNIISKSAKETQGIYASGAYGSSSFRDFIALRYGSHIDTTVFFRVYAQRYDFESTTLPDGMDAKDAWNISEGGFRMDCFPSAKNTFTLQGDLYDGTEDDSASTLVNGQNIIGRWTHAYSGNSALTIQSYFDRTYRNIQIQDFIDELNTFDIDMQHNFAVGKRHKIVWGLGYRIADDDINSISDNFIPARRTLQLYSGFIQDQVALSKDLELTFGSKVLHNDYTGFEFHPTIRLAWIPDNKNTLWAAISQAVRTPTRLETDNSSPGLGSFGDFKSEKVIVYELGYRMRPISNISFSVAIYYNQYRDLRSIDTNHTPPPAFYFGNNLKANTYGVELSADVILTRWWKIRGGYTYLYEDFTTTAPTTYPQSNLIEAIDPKNQFLIQSMMDVAKNFQIDGIVRYVDVIPQALTNPSVPSYITFDLRLGWNYKWLSLAVAGQNLAEKYHGSSGNIRIPRSYYGRITINF